MKEKKINVDLIKVDGGVTTITKTKIKVPHCFDKPDWVRFCIDDENAYYFFDTYPFSDLHQPNRTLTLGKGYK